jgi:hypothetical protein
MCASELSSFLRSPYKSLDLYDKVAQVGKYHQIIVQSSNVPLSMMIHLPSNRNRNRNPTPRDQRENTEIYLYFPQQSEFGDALRNPVAGPLITLVTSLRLENVNGRTGTHTDPLEVIRIRNPL